MICEMKLPQNLFMKRTKPNINPPQGQIIPVETRAFSGHDVASALCHRLFDDDGRLRDRGAGFIHCREIRTVIELLLRGFLH